MIALVYMLCVLAPTLSFAMPGSQASPYCLSVEDKVDGMVHVHRDGSMDVRHDRHAGHHSSIEMLADSSADHRAQAVMLESDSIPAQTTHAMDGKCCGLMCVTALAVPFLAVMQPAAPTAIQLSDSYRELADSASAVHYRPPIS